MSHPNIGHIRTAIAKHPAWADPAEWWGIETKSGMPARTWCRILWDPAELSPVFVALEQEERIRDDEHATLLVRGEVTLAIYDGGERVTISMEHADALIEAIRTAQRLTAQDSGPAAAEPSPGAATRGSGATGGAASGS